MGATVQVRMYVIKEGMLEAFVQLFDEQVVPVRRRFGFTVVGAWTVPEERRFIWVAGYDGPGSIEEADERYYASPDRLAIDPSPTSMMDGSQTWFASPVHDQG